MEPQKIRVVVVARDNKIYRSELLESQLEKKGHQIVLPKDVYSAGFCNRVWGIVWDELEWLPS